MNAEELQALVATISAKGGSITPRELYHSSRRYRRSSTALHSLLQELADAGIGHWEGKMLRLEPDAETRAQRHSPAPTPAQQPIQGVVTSLADGGTDSAPKNEEEPPPIKRPRDQYGFFLPGPIKPAKAKPEPKEPSKPEGELGLGRIPGEWPQLPDNASLQAEIAWVQANRVSILENGEPQLERATSPAPSRSALGWLETSIRAYSKYVDVVARTLAGAQDEQSEGRRELLALEEIEQLLSV